MEPGDHARFDIDRKGQPGTPNGLAVFAINAAKCSKAVSAAVSIPEDAM
jgi:hypothetical protein